MNAAVASVATPDTASIAVNDLPDGTRRIAVSGRLDAVTIPSIWNPAHQAVAEAKNHVIVDAAGVEYCDGVGAALFVELMRHAPDGKLEVTNLRPAFQTLLNQFDPKVLACSGAKRDGCLSSEQAAAIEKAFSGPRDSRGRQVYPPFPYDTGVTATGGGIPGLLSPGPSPLGQPNRSLQQDVDAEAATQAANPQAILSDTASWTNLNTFSGHGGKLIFFHGMSDPWFSANDTIDYYTRMGAANGGAQQVQSWSRLFLSPGMGHCAGGQSLDSFDLLTALVDWVEKGTAPDAVIATGRAFPGRSRPLCAYPKSAYYKGSGDTQDSRNFECR